MRKLLPIVFALLGLAGGVGGGLALRPGAGTDASHEVAINPCGEPAAATDAGTEDHGGEADQAETDGHDEAAVDSHGEPTREFVKLNNQFIVPVISEGAVSAMVILSVSLEVRLGATEQVYALEPKLRDSFLQVLFDHANAGGFEGAFTQANNMKVLRVALMEVAKKTLGSTVLDVLIVDIVRQDT